MSSNVNHSLLAFLQASPTPFHATQSLESFFHERGFIQLQETDEWDIQPGQGYYYSRSGSSFIAFIAGKKPILEGGIRVIGAHTDSPCLKLKPQPGICALGYQQLSVEVYGGVLLNPWFDRDLSLAGRVSYQNSQGKLASSLVDFKRPVATVPSLAIHLDRTANENRTVNAQTEMSPVVGLGSEFDLRRLLKAQLEEQKVTNVREVLDFNLCCYDTQPPALVGFNQEFIASARLDNLLSCYIGAEALATSDGEQTAVLVCNDHEEVGSRTDIGAQGPMLQEWLQRLIPDAEIRRRVIRGSLMVSVDNAHGVHPNFKDKHDQAHGPVLNQGPVIKFDADQGYATNDVTSSFLRWLGAQGECEVPLQSYVTRADMRCGSTIGPLTASNTGIKAVDIGVPTFAMHSIRELAGTKDTQNLLELLKKFVLIAELPKN